MSVAPPRPKMPPLNALRAFEASARLTSFSAAAEELFVTPAAIAQHVKSLEAWAGEKLFKRNPQGIELTPLGAAVLPEFTIAFDALGTAVQKLRTHAAPLEIRIAALPSVAQLWLSPRLPEIRAAMPDVSISVSALERRPNLRREPFDLAIFYENHGSSPNAIIVNQDVIFPVASPLVAKRLNGLSDLANEIFLHDSTWKDDWQSWLTKTAPGHHLGKSGPEYSLYSLALEECKNGAGVLMGHEDLVRPHIATGELVAPFEDKVLLPRNLAITTSGHLTPATAVGALIDMLLAQA